MSNDSWTCLMVEDGPGMLDDDVRAALKLAACELALKKWERMNILCDVCDGVIQTAWNTQMVGARSGVLFRAHIDSGTGEYRVNFLLSTEDLARGAEFLREMKEDAEQGAWFSGTGKIPCDALYHFYDLNETKRTVN